METPTGCCLNGFASARPLDVFGVSREGAGHRQDLARLDADVFWQSLNPGSRTCKADQTQTGTMKKSMWSDWPCEDTTGACWCPLAPRAASATEDLLACFDQKMVEILPIALNEDPSRWEDVSPRLLELMA